MRNTGADSLRQGMPRDMSMRGASRKANKPRLRARAGMDAGKLCGRVRRNGKETGHDPYTLMRPHGQHKK